MLNFGTSKPGVGAVADPWPVMGKGVKKHEIYAAAFGGHLFYD